MKKVLPVQQRLALKFGYKITAGFEVWRLFCIFANLYPVPNDIILSSIETGFIFYKVKYQLTKTTGFAIFIINLMRE